MLFKKKLSYENVGDDKDELSMSFKTITVDSKEKFKNDHTFDSSEEHVNSFIDELIVRLMSAESEQRYNS